MKQSVNFYDFCRAFETSGRNDNFSYEGKRALFDYLEDYEDSCGEDLELDVVALCCEFSEYPSAVECISDCGYDYIPRDCYDEDERENSALEYLNDNTLLIQFDGGIIIQDF
jgi:hypothetical protein